MRRDRSGWAYGFFTGLFFGGALGLYATLIWLSIAGRSIIQP